MLLREDRIDLLASHKAHLDDDVSDVPALSVAALGNKVTIMVAHSIVKEGYDTNAVAHLLLALGSVSSDAIDALVRKGDTGIPKKLKTLESALKDHGLHNVELQLSSISGTLDRGVVPTNLEGNLVANFRNNGVHLAGHDGRAGLEFREVDFLDTATRTGAHEAEIIADLGHMNRETVEGVMETDVGTSIRCGGD